MLQSIVSSIPKAGVPALSTRCVHRTMQSLVKGRCGRPRCLVASISQPQAVHMTASYSVISYLTSMFGNCLVCTPTGPQAALFLQPSCAGGVSRSRSKHTCPMSQRHLDGVLNLTFSCPTGRAVAPASTWQHTVPNHGPPRLLCNGISSPSPSKLCLRALSAASASCDMSGPSSLVPGPAQALPRSWQPRGRQPAGHRANGRTGLTVRAVSNGSNGTGKKITQNQFTEKAWQVRAFVFALTCGQLLWMKKCIASSRRYLRTLTEL